MATTDMRDIRFDRIDQEYLSLRSTQDKLIISLDQVLSTMAKGIQENRGLILENRTMIQENRAMIQENRTMIQENRDLILENRDLILENRELIQENRADTQENRAMLLAIIKHLEVPYQPKRPMGFNIDPRPKD